MVIASKQYKYEKFKVLLAYDISGKGLLSVGF